MSVSFIRNNVLVSFCQALHSATIRCNLLEVKLVVALGANISEKDAEGVSI